jgi:hypothetical protein
MEYKFHFDEGSGICTVLVTGRHNRPQDSLTLQKFARDFGHERGCHLFLFDMTKAEIHGGTMETYKTGTVPVDPDFMQIRQRIALLYSTNMNKHIFMENVAINRGYQVRVFDKMDKAIEWLKPKRVNK